MDGPEVLSTQLIVHEPDGTRYAMDIRVTKEPPSDQPPTFTVYMSGLLTRPHRAMGSEPMQALSLALRFVRDELEMRESLGFKFCWPPPEPDGTVFDWRAFWFWPPAEAG